MKLVRFSDNNRNSGHVSCWGIMQEDHIEIIDGTPFGEWEKTSQVVKIYDVRFLAPCVPSKIICVGLNYTDHVEEMKLGVPDEPVLFMKPPSSILDPGENIIKPEECQRLDYEAELAVVIGKEGKNIPVEKVSEYILGYTCFNDVTARDIQKKDGQWTRAKGFDTFSPIGPQIETDVDPLDLTPIRAFLQHSCHS